MAQDQINHIQSLFAAQHAALSIAYQNLEHHLAPLREEWNSLFRLADERLKEQAQLLESAPNDLALLPRVTIHPVFWAKRDPSGNVVNRGKDDAKAKTMADYIHSRKMEEVLETCRASHRESKSSSLFCWSGRSLISGNGKEVSRSGGPDRGLATDVRHGARPGRGYRRNDSRRIRSGDAEA